MKCDAPVERDFDIEAEPLQEGLCWGLESEAFPWGEVVHEEDVLEAVAVSWAVLPESLAAMVKRLKPIYVPTGRRF